LRTSGAERRARRDRPRAARRAAAARAAALALAVLSASLVAVPPEARAPTLEEIKRRAESAEPGAFGSVRFPVESAGAYPQWRTVLARTRAQMATLRDCLADRDAHAVCTGRDWRRWLDVIARARARDGMDRLQTVNRFFNQWPYREDFANYGRRERWVSPATFLKSSGDCEDYAIAKYATLRLAGVPDTDMRIVVVRDRIRAIRHAVLVVERPAETSVLDSLSNGIFADSAYGHYAPEYSLNASGQWTHAPSGRGGE
jgi:predicted transglutaminase-like cysteine proteinase